MDKIAVVVRHTKLTEEEDLLNYDDHRDWERSLPRQYIKKEELADFLEQCSRRTERMTAISRADLIVSFEYWPEFVLVQIYDDYIE